MDSQAATSSDEIRLHESQGALAYWTAWHELPITYPRVDLPRIPDHWRTFGSRISPLTRSPRLAVNPPNAMLNYLYALLESEARLALSTLGLDPGIGVLHSDTRNRDSLACDLMEPVRPQVDAFLLDWLEQAPLRREWFFEERNGNCRLISVLATRLAETSHIWRKALAPYAEGIARALWSMRSKSARSRGFATRLTQSRKREAKGISVQVSVKPSAAFPASCRICGVSIKLGLKYCRGCVPTISRENVHEAPSWAVWLPILRRPKHVVLRHKGGRMQHEIHGIPLPILRGLPSSFTKITSGRQSVGFKFQPSRRIWQFRSRTLCEFAAVGASLIRGIG